jgi:hypothetical protein
MERGHYRAFKPYGGDSDMERIRMIWILMAMALLAIAAAQSANLCNRNGNCEWPETCNTCSDCHSCDITSYTGQRAKYIDRTCQHNGNGLADSCASSAGGTGRYNELQAAIDSLVAGDTLYIHPGDYYRAKQDYGNYEVRSRNSGTAARPIIITARYRDNPPVLHSTNPAGGSTQSPPAITTHWDDPAIFLIIDGIRVRGLAQITGRNNILQNIDCTYGGGACDGNWACLRIEWCTDCIAHHNFVHDVNDAGFCPAGTSRPCGLKEFSSTRAIWEYNTVRNALQWGYDLHRSSTDPTVRFNKFENSGGSVSIRVARSGDNFVYGNIATGPGQCIQGLELTSASVSEHEDLFEHNTCIHPSLGIATDSSYRTIIKNNIVAYTTGNRIEGGNINIMGSGHDVDYNSYDSNGYYHSGMYQSRDYDSLSSWQQVSGLDMHSREAAGTACQFIDAPTSSTDFTYDLHVTGTCLTSSSTGGQVGAYAITDCVGHTCGTNTIPQPSCGDGACGSGETCSSCPSDCPTPSGQVCCSGVLRTGNCCQNTECPQGQVCSNYICSGPVCGNGNCESGETCSSCPSDCPTPSGQVCCSGVLRTGNCCQSTECQQGQSCVNNVCTAVSNSPCVNPPSGVFFCEDFEDNIPNSFNSQYYGNLQSSSQFSITGTNAATGSYSVMRQYTQGSSTDAFVTQHFGDATKTPVWTAGQGEHYQDIYVYYKVYYSPGFNFSADNNKQIIFGTDDGQRHDEACCNPWVAHYTTIASRTGYFDAELNNKRANDNSIWYGLSPNIGYSSSSRFTIQPGRWYSVQVRRRLNDAGLSNGIFEMWVDGVKVAYYSNLVYRVPDTGTFGTDFNYGTNFVMLSTYIPTASPRTQQVYFDDVMIGTAPYRRVVQPSSYRRQ